MTQTVSKIKRLITSDTTRNGHYSTLKISWIYIWLFCVSMKRCLVSKRPCLDLDDCFKLYGRIYICDFDKTNFVLQRNTTV